MEFPIYEVLIEYLDYNPSTGIFTWKKRPSGCTSVNPGDIAGSPNSHGYIYISFQKKKYSAHKLAWFMTFGAEGFDSLLIDHINRNRTDNRIANLRLASPSDNNHNSKRAKGYYKNQQGSYTAQISIDGSNCSLGRYPCPLLARLAYEEKKRELCGEFSPV